MKNYLKIKKLKTCLPLGMVKNFRKKGFSLMELIIAMFVFSIVMTASVGVFTSMIKGYKTAKAVQRNLEQAQFAMNLIAKTLRTGSVTHYWDLDAGIIDHASGSDAVRVYDYSQKKCVRFEITGNKATDSYKLITASKTADKIDECLQDYSEGWLTPDNQVLVDGYVTGNFNIEASCKNSITYGSDGTTVIPSGCGNGTTPRVGKVTISLQVCADSSCKDKANIQTTVSLRNYQELSP